MQVIGHGIPDPTIVAMLGATDGFFASPLDEKMTALPPHAGINRGYAPLGTEALAYSLGVEPSVTDLFEAFDIGPDHVPDDEWHAAAPFDLFAPNVWPEAAPELARPAHRLLRRCRRCRPTSPTSSRWRSGRPRGGSGRSSIVPPSP